MLYMENTGNNEGGRHACYRALKTFLYWWEEELEPEGWKNPIRRVKPPRLSVSPLEPVDLDDFLMRSSMLANPGEITLPVLDEVSMIIGKSPSWTGEQLAEEVSPVRRILKEGLDTEL